MKQQHVSLLIIVTVFFLTFQNLRFSLTASDQQRQQLLHDDQRDALKIESEFRFPANSGSEKDTHSNAIKEINAKTKVAYAVTVTGFDDWKMSQVMLDRAAVLHHSIKLAMRKSHRYGYDMYAFVHPDAIGCAANLTRLGYTVQIRETPFNLSQVQNIQLIDAQRIGCCGEKEYLKLYSYLLFDYPVVVHLDLDTIVLKPMDDAFDLMIDPNYNRSYFNSSTMWTNMDTYDGKVDFLFTRDYNMVDPPRRQVHQIGVQGGFLVVRPSQSDFDNLVSIILSGGDWVSGKGWGGGKLLYGGYYGAATIQGLASYYYGHLQHNRSIELNRCHYNTMVDSPYSTKKNTTRCRTLESTCEDCRTTPLENVYTAHFTTCGKPDRCRLSALRLCMELFAEWHKTRRSLEDEWMFKYPDYSPEFETINTTSMSTNDPARASKQGHCGKTLGYFPMVFPNVTATLI